MRVSVFALATALALVIGGSAQSAPGPSPAELAKSLIEEASAAPVEIFADIALRQGFLQLLPAGERAATLERAFRRAGEAREQWPLTAALSPAPLSGSEIALAYNPALDRLAGASLRLDSLSIRCRVVQALLGIDPKLARALFEEITRPAPPKASCADNSVPDPGIYLETLAAVAERGEFSDEERRKGVPWLLIERGLTGISGALETATAARTFAPLVKSEPQAQALSTKLAIAMSQSDSDRAFTLALRRSLLITHVLKVAYAARAAGASDAVLITALRGYLTRHLSGTRCRDNSGANPRADTPTVEAFAEYLGDGERTDIAPITPEERVPSKLEDAYAPPAYANAPEFQALMKQVEDLPVVPMIQLRTSPPILHRTPMREFPESRARDTLSRIGDLKGVMGQEPVEVFHEKCRLIASILTAPALDGLRWITVNEAAGILGDPIILQRAPAEWLAEVQDLLGQAGLFGLSAKTSASPSGRQSPTTLRADLAAALADSRLSVLSLYGRIERFNASKK